MIHSEIYGISIQERIDELNKYLQPVEYPDEMSGKISEAIANSNGVNELISRAERSIQDQIDQLEIQKVLDA